MNILITGINGFIGRNLSSHLNNKKYNILGLSRNRESLNKQVIFGDLNDLYKIKNSIINFKRIKNELSHIPQDKLASWSLNWVLENKNVKSSVMAFRNTNQLENIINNANWK